MSKREIYHRILDRAKAMVEDNERLRTLLIKVGDKLSGFANGTKENEGLVLQLRLFIRMIRAHINGVYQSFEPMTLLMFAFALVYFITPIDLIPDFVPALGFTDDIAVVIMIIRRFSTAIRRYRKWEESELVQ